MGNRAFRPLALAAALLLGACASREQEQIPVATSEQCFGSLPAGATRPSGTVTDWLRDMRRCVRGIPATFAVDANAAQRTVLDIYMHRQEYLEVYYGEQGRVSKGGPLGFAVMSAERMFHDLMALTAATPKTDSVKIRALVDSVDAKLGEVERIAIDSKVTLTPPDSVDDIAAATADASPPRFTPIIALVERARAANAAGHRDSAKRIIENAYLEEFEPIEPLLPSGVVARVEELVHMRLRPQLAAHNASSETDAHFGALTAELNAASERMEAGQTAWFGIVSSFFIVVREGLEAVLLIAALVAYLSRSDDLRAQRRNVYAGAGAGIALTFVTWVAARTLIPISGGNRELMEGITALVAVAVLLYVSHWIFRRTYMGEWKDFLRKKVERAAATGSTFAVGALGFAAVYREGFETVLFYEALLVDLPGASVATGFAAGAVVVGLTAFAVIRAGLRLPLKTVFRATNAILLFLSVAILGKGLYNLQEAGLFSPHPLNWLPNSELLRQVLGFYPLAETLIAQLALVTLVVVMYVVYRRKATVASATA